MLLCVIIFITAPRLAWSYGGGGGGGGEGGGSASQKSPPSKTSIPSVHNGIKPLTAQQIRDVFTTIGKDTPGVDDVTVSIMTTILEGSEMSVRDLISIRQGVLQVDGWSSQVNRAQATINLIQVQIMDGMGKVSQTILTVIPGVGWGTNAALGVARAGADKIKEGGDIYDAGGAALIDGTVSVITSQIPFGKQGGEMLGNGAKNLGRAATQVAKQKVKKRWTRKAGQQIAGGLVNIGKHLGTNAAAKTAVEMTAQEVQEIMEMAARTRARSQVANQAPQTSVCRQTVSIPEMRSYGDSVPQMRAFK